MRFVYLHNHIFKNAGSTIDHLFERAGFRNVRMEASAASDTVYPRMVLEAVARDPAIEYISSHLLRAPRPPDQENLGFVDITFLRHPVDRLHSMYSYSRKHATDDFPVAKDASFPEFVDRLAALVPLHLHSPQTTCLGGARDFYFPPNHVHLERAKAAILETRFLGVVDLFAQSVEAFVNACGPLMAGKDLGAFAGPFPAVNRSSRSSRGLEERLCAIRAQLGEERYSSIERANEADLTLYRCARDEVLRRHSLMTWRAPRGT